LINVLGLVHGTPADIRNRPAEMLAVPTRGSRFAFVVGLIHPIRINVAVVDTDIAMTGL